MTGQPVDYRLGVVGEFLMSVIQVPDALEVNRALRDKPGAASWVRLDCVDEHFEPGRHGVVHAGGHLVLIAC